MSLILLILFTLPINNIVLYSHIAQSGVPVPNIPITPDDNPPSGDPATPGVPVPDIPITPDDDPPSGDPATPGVPVPDIPITPGSGDPPSGDPATPGVPVPDIPVTPGDNPPPGDPATPGVPVPDIPVTPGSGDPPTGPVVIPENPPVRLSLWNKFLNELADPTINHVKCPPGSWDVTKTILINRSDLIVDFSDSTIIPKNGLFMPIYVGGPIQPKEYHAMGLVKTDTRTLILDSNDLIDAQPGDLHAINLGVNRYDPNEPQSTIIRMVSSINGNTITYDRSFDFEPTIYASLDVLRANTQYPEKVGAWGPGSVYGSQQLRGIGFDHGIKKITKRTDNVIIIRPKIYWPIDSRMYGSWGISINYCRDIFIINAEVINPHGSAIHIIRSEGVIIDGLLTTGEGRSAPFGPGNATKPTASATAVSIWGGLNILLKWINVESEDTALTNFEAGFRNITIENSKIVAKRITKYAATPNFGVYGGGGNVIFRDITIDTPVLSSSLFPGGLGGVKFENLTFVRPEIPDWLAWTGRGEHIGNLRWNDSNFDKITDAEVIFIPTKDGFEIPYPDGIIVSAEYHLTSRDNIRDVTTPSSCFLNTTDNILRPNSNSFQIRIGDTYAKYRDQLKQHKFWIVRNSTVERVTMKLKIMRKL